MSTGDPSYPCGCRGGIHELGSPACKYPPPRTNAPFGRCNCPFPKHGDECHVWIGHQQRETTPAQELKMAQRLEALNRRRAVLIAYVQSKLEAEDWHAVGDAANDLRELDVEIRMTR